MRATARETLFKTLFAAQFNGCTDKNLMRTLSKNEKLDKNDNEYCEKMLGLLEEHSGEISDILDSHSRLFPESRLFPADRSVLYIALAEILYTDDIPNAVSVNEAANIASKYSSEKSASFISGILSEIIREKNNG